MIKTKLWTVELNGGACELIAEYALTTEALFYGLVSKDVIKAADAENMIHDMVESAIENARHKLDVHEHGNKDAGIDEMIDNLLDLLIGCMGGRKEW